MAACGIQFGWHGSMLATKEREEDAHHDRQTLQSGQLAGVEALGLEASMNKEPRSQFRHREFQLLGCDEQIATGKTKAMLRTFPSTVNRIMRRAYWKQAHHPQSYLIHLIITMPWSRDSSWVSVSLRCKPGPEHQTKANHISLLSSSATLV